MHRYVEPKERWAVIESGLRNVKNNFEKSTNPKISAEDHIRLYTAVYDLCKQEKQKQALYNRCVAFMEDYMRSTVLPPLRERDDEFLLRDLVKRWFHAKAFIRWLYHFFYYLHCHFIALKALRPLTAVGHSCFQNLVYKEIDGKVRDAVLSLINREREGENIDKSLVKNVVDFYVELGMDFYRNEFEVFMLKDTRIYYSQKASIWIQEDSCSNYIFKVNAFLKQEKDKAEHRLHSTSEPKILEIVRQELYKKEPFERELSRCHAFVGDEQIKYLSRTFKLFSVVPQAVDSICSVYKQFVTAEAMALVKQAEDAVTKEHKQEMVGVREQVFLRELIELHEKHLAYVKYSFQNHASFNETLKEVFELFCNKNVPGSCGGLELLVTFCDDILKKGASQKLSEEAIEESVLEKVVSVIAYIRDKDLFAESYRKKLARRLLFDRGANIEHERSMLTKLKQKLGDLVTLKIEGMIMDLIVSKERQTTFEEYLGNHPNAGLGMDFTVAVLTTNFWPSHQSSNVNLPQEMIKCTEAFKEFYLTRTKHRRLTWIYSCGTCNISGNFENKTIELITTTYQGAALLLFNSSERLSYSEIKTQLNLSKNEVMGLLHSLSCAKYKILKKEPDINKICSTDYFEFNSKFTNKLRRIKIPVPPVSSEKKKGGEEVEKDRRYAIDACILRIMKSRRVLSHQQLVMECIEQLDPIFQPPAPAIKKRIEDLIFREFIERDKDEANLYRYLA